jgi:hypothetical protein
MISTGIILVIKADLKVSYLLFYTFVNINYNIAYLIFHFVYFYLIINIDALKVKKLDTIEIFLKIWILIS